MNSPIEPKSIPEAAHDLLERPLLAALATTLPNGTPQVTPVWFNYQDGYIYFNTAAGRLKERAIRHTPYVAVLISDPDNPFRYLQVRGPVVEIDEAHGREHINALSKRYTGSDVYGGPPDETRVRLKLAPEFVQFNG